MIDYSKIRRHERCLDKESREYLYLPVQHFSDFLSHFTFDRITMTIFTIHTNQIFTVCRT